jgi:hypothetical protein
VPSEASAAALVAPIFLAWAKALSTKASNWARLLLKPGKAADEDAGA